MVPLRWKLCFQNLTCWVSVSFVPDASPSAVLVWLKFQEIDPPVSHCPSCLCHWEIGYCELSSFQPAMHKLLTELPFSWQISAWPSFLYILQLLVLWYPHLLSHKPTYFLTFLLISPWFGYQWDFNSSFWVTALCLFKYCLHLQQSWHYYLLVAKKEDF